MRSVSQEVFDGLLETLRKANKTKWEQVMKSTVNSAVAGTSTGFQPFNLDLQGKLLLPQFTPLQNRGLYAVKSGESGDSREYRAISGMNTKKHTGKAGPTGSVLSTTDTGRSPVVDYTFLTKKKFFDKFAPEAAIDWELYKSSGPFNALGKVTIASLITAKELEERHILGASSTALGTPVGIAGTPLATGGTLTNAASPYTVKVIALNYYGWWYWLADGIAAADITPDTSHGMAAGAVQTESIASAATGALTIPGGGVITGSISAKCTPVKGAFAYIWLIENAGLYKLGTVTTTPFATITALGSLTVAVPTADGSAYDTDAQPVVWDGLFAQIALDADLPGQYLSLATNSSPGVLTPTGSGCGVSEFETIMLQIAQRTFLSPKVAIMSMATLANASNVIIGNAAPAYRILVDGEKSGVVNAGTIVKAVKNQYMQTMVELIPHPLLPDGKVLWYTDVIDYPDSNVSKNLELHTAEHFLQDFYARVTDVAPPGPWAIKTYGAPTLYYPKCCGVNDDIKVT